MKKVKSQGLGVSTLYSPLNATLSLVDVGNIGLRQFYYRTEQAYEPDHEITPLILRPDVSVYDPDSKQAYKPTYSSVTWYVTDKNGTTTAYTADDTSADFSVGEDGSLIMRKNVPYGNGLTLRCSVAYIDSRKGTTETIEESVTVTTDDVAESTYSIKVSGLYNGNATGDRIYWRPLSNISPIVSFTAKAMQGNDDVSSTCKFFWYYMFNGSLVAVDDSNNPLLALVSLSSNGSTITLNADYESDGIELYVKMADSTTATAPNVPFVKARANISWDTRRLRGRAYSVNGDTARADMVSHTYKVLYRQNGVDIPEEIANKRIVTEWTLEKINPSTGAKISRYLGTGASITLPESEVIGNQYPVNVVPEGKIIGAMVAVTHGGKVVTHGGKIVTGRKF